MTTTSLIFYTNGSVGIRIDGAEKPLPNVGVPISVAPMADGRVLCLGTDGQLYYRATWDGAWTKSASPDVMTSVAVLPDGTILAAGRDTLLYTRATPTSAWVKIAGSQAVLSVVATPDGSVYGIGTDKNLWRRATLMGGWASVAISNAKPLISIGYDGTDIIGVQADNRAYALRGGSWAATSLPAGVKEVRAILASASSALAQGCLVFYGDSSVGVQLGGGEKKLPNIGVPISVAAMADGRILCLGTAGNLYCRATWDGAWTECPGSTPPMKSVAVLPDGKILAAGRDTLLYTRATPTSAWVQIAGSQAVTSVAATPDGSVYGIGTDKNLWRRATLMGGWASVAISNARPLVSIGYNGTDVIGVQEDNRAYALRGGAWAVTPLPGGIKEVRAPLASASSAPVVLRFGGDGYVSVPDFAWGGTGYFSTVEFWCRVASDELTASVLVDVGGEAGKDSFQANVPWSDGSLYWDFGAPGATSVLNPLNPRSFETSTGVGRIVYDFRPCLGKWVHVALTGGYQFTGIFINGTLVASRDCGNYPTKVLRPLIVGWRNGWAKFKGRVANLRIWERKLGVGEIQKYMLEAPAPDAPGLCGDWSMTDGSGTAVRDRSRQGKHGVINGTLTWERDPSLQVARDKLRSLVDQGVINQGSQGAAQAAAILKTMYS